MAESQKKNPLGPTGETVADNIKRLRGDMQYVKLAALLADLGRPIPTLGLRKIESYERRVDADDLVALAEALGVSPVTLLMPHTNSPDKTVAATGLGSTTAADLWHWIVGNGRHGMPLVDHINFLRNSLPPWIFAEREAHINSQIGSMFSTPAVRDVLRPQEDS